MVGKIDVVDVDFIMSDIDVCAYLGVCRAAKRGENEDYCKKFLHFCKNCEQSAKV
jgi:hypothetical protein